MAESGDLIDFVKKHYTREAVDAQEMLKNGVSEVNENAERILSEGISRMQEDLQVKISGITAKVDKTTDVNTKLINTSVSDMTRKFDASIEANASTINQAISEIKRTTTDNAELINKHTETMGENIASFTREINVNIIEMKNRVAIAESAAKMASRMAAISLGGFIALLIFILIGS